MTKKAFTLSEVLITLGIIGIVAAMTMPAIIQDFRRKEASARLKKFYSMMSQAIIMSEIDNGDVSGWEKNSEDSSDNKRIINGQYGYDFFMTYLAPYIKYVSIDKAEAVENEEDMKSYECRVHFIDSSIMYLHNGGCIDMTFDYNGYNLPNSGGKDRFVFTLCITDSSRETWYGTTKIAFNTYGPVYATTREAALSKCKSNTSYCSTLLLYDDWEFKDDYPYKL